MTKKPDTDAIREREEKPDNDELELKLAELKKERQELIRAATWLMEVRKALEASTPKGEE